jgi:hypothetical protein
MVPVDVMEVLALTGLTMIIVGLATWRYGERINRLFLRRASWWPGAGWHADNVDKCWYKTMMRAGSVWFVALGTVAVALGVAQLVRS